MNELPEGRWAVGSGGAGDARWSAWLGPRRHCHLHPTLCLVIWFHFSSGKWIAKDAAEANKISLELMPIKKPCAGSG